LAPGRGEAEQPCEVGWDAVQDHDREKHQKRDHQAGSRAGRYGGERTKRAVIAEIG
jgi:hypothetical protein